MKNIASIVGALNLIIAGYHVIMGEYDQATAAALLGCGMLLMAIFDRLQEDQS